MRKHFSIFFAILSLSLAVQAQTNKTKSKAKPVTKKSATLTKQVATTTSTGWSAEEKTVFFDACIKELNWSKDSATQYCSCMLSKIEKLYPSAKDSDNMTQEKAFELAKECLAPEGQPSVWGAKERTQFSAQCEAVATKTVGADKAKSYCSCMLIKIEKEFPNPGDLSKMKEETVAKWAEECSKQ